MRRLAKAHGPATPPPALDDAALLAELGASAQGWARDDAEAALLAQLQGALATAHTHAVQHRIVWVPC
jgi:hypothetical protein